MEFLIYVCLPSLSALLTHQFSKQPCIGPLRASAIVSLVCCMCLYLLNHFYPLSHLPHYEALVFGGAFVGVAHEAKYTLKMIALGGGILGLIFYFLEPHTFGYGGAIGSSAFIACISIYGLTKLRQQIHSKLNR